METSKTTTVNQQVAKLYEKYAHELHLYFLSYTHDNMTADDMVQDVFIKVLRLDIIEEVSAKHLLFCAARRIMLDDARHKKYVCEARQYFRNNLSEVQNCTIYDELETRQFIEFEERHLLSMPAKRAQVYRLWRSGEFSFKEIGQQLSISQRTAEAHVYLAVKELKEYFRKVI
ncbi:MAG: sigma-70 family RNA polymerase sigma factor [Prevotella sp.]|nr:sigma-70 family RNA polymerase sigma factor [Prevotella sp.]